MPQGECREDPAKKREGGDVAQVLAFGRAGDFHHLGGESSGRARKFKSLIVEDKRGKANGRTEEEKEGRARHISPVPGHREGWGLGGGSIAKRGGREEETLNGA